MFMVYSFLFTFIAFILTVSLEKFFNFKYNKTEKIIITMILFLALFPAVYSTFINTLYDKVKNGDVELYCRVNNSYKYVPKESVIGFDDENKLWIFKNGYVKNCILINKKELDEEH